MVPLGMLALTHASSSGQTCTSYCGCSSPRTDCRGDCVAGDPCGGYDDCLNQNVCHEKTQESGSCSEKLASAKDPHCDKANLNASCNFDNLACGFSVSLQADSGCWRTHVEASQYTRAVCQYEYE